MAVTVAEILLNWLIKETCPGVSRVPIADGKLSTTLLPFTYVLPETPIILEVESDSDS